MDDNELYASIASNLEESGWSKIFSEMDKDALGKLFEALKPLQEVAEEKTDEVPEDTAAALKMLNEKMDRMSKGLKIHRKRFDKINQRLKAIEENGGGGGGGSAGANDDDDDVVVTKKPRAKKTRKLRSQASNASAKEEKEDAGIANRKVVYRFGSRPLQVVKPTEGYPSAKDARLPPQGKLELFYAHGYHGAEDNARCNLYLSQDGKLLIYYIAAVGIVYDFGNNTQRFFTRHNDDVTCVCTDPASGSSLVATGQKDPKDTPGQGQDWPKIWVWDYNTMKGVQLIDNVCWGAVGKLQWSTNGILYMVGGDPDQTLKAWDKKDFKGKGNPPELIKMNTMKEQILGFKVNPNPPAGTVDELVFFGTKKYTHLGLSKSKKGLTGKLRSVATTQFKKDGEKAFVCCEFLPDGIYAVGGASGAIFLNKGSVCLAVVDAHKKCVGDLVWDSTTQRLITSGFDRSIKKFSLQTGGSGAATSPEKDKKGKEKGKKLKTPKAGAGGKGPSLTETWTVDDVNIPNSDFVLQPKAMCYHPETGNLFVGTKTNQVMKYNMNGNDEKEPCASVIVDGHDGAIWGLCTHPEEPYFATGGYDNAIKVWDAKDMTCIFTYEFELPQGVRKGKQVNSAAWSNDGGCIVFGTEDSCIAVFKWDNTNNQCEFQQMIEIPAKTPNSEIEPVSYLRFSEDSQLLGAAHMDSNVYIYSVDGGAGGRYVLSKWDPLPHVAAPTHLQFNNDGTMLKSFTRDYEICHWKLNIDARKAKFVVNTPDPDKVEWAGDPLIAGWDVQGLYQKGWDGTDLNDATLTSDGKLIISGDDYGTVRLHNYPAVDPTACIEYTGHAEFVVGVELLRDDSQLITCGGNDMAIFQWRLHKKEA